jgi:hypothetical protein
MWRITLAVVLAYFAIATPARASVTEQWGTMGLGMSLAFAPAELQSCLGADGSLNIGAADMTAHYDGLPGKPYKVTADLSAFIRLDDNTELPVGTAKLRAHGKLPAQPGILEVDPVVLQVTTADSVVHRVAVRFSLEVNAAENGRLAFTQTLLVIDFATENTDIFCAGRGC